MGVDNKALALYIKRGFPGAKEPFPEAIQRIASGPLWLKSDVKRYQRLIRLAGSLNPGKIKKEE